jgi:hypothetical protein
MKTRVSEVLTVWLSLGSNSTSFCLSLPSLGIISMHYHTEQYFRIFFFVSVAGLEIESRVLNLLGKCYTTWITPPAPKDILWLTRTISTLIPDTEKILGQKYHYSLRVHSVKGQLTSPSHNLFLYLCPYCLTSFNKIPLPRIRKRPLLWLLHFEFF